MTERLRTVQLVPQPTRERSFSRSASCHPACRKFLAACNVRSIESTVFAESGKWREVLPNRYARWALRRLPICYCRAQRHAFRLVRLGCQACGNRR